MTVHFVDTEQLVLRVDSCRI